jgi:hypothetical protein
MLKGCCWSQEGSFHLAKAHVMMVNKSSESHLRVSNQNFRRKLKTLQHIESVEKIERKSYCKRSTMATPLSPPRASMATPPLPAFLQIIQISIARRIGLGSINFSVNK